MPRPTVNKVLAYRKCQQCRKDRQKCSPEARAWPGRRCDRCQRYGYACSANRTKDEETAPSNLGDFTRQDAGSEVRQTLSSPEPGSLPQGDAQFEARMTSFSPEPGSLPQGNAEFEARCLQELGDYRQLVKTCQMLHFLPDSWGTTPSIGARIDDCVEKITVQAQSHQTQGRYKDAEYLYRQLEATSAPLDPANDSLLKPGLDMVLIYEKLGNLPAAEIFQEHRLLLSMCPEQRSEDAIISREAGKLFRLYMRFLARIEDPKGVWLVMLPGLTVFHRIAVLRCSILNNMLFQSELWKRCNPRLCLHIAIRIESTEMIRDLISIGVDMNKSGVDWSSPLLAAAQYGNLDSLKLLLENNVAVGVKSQFSRTALHHAMLRDGKQRDETYEIICRLIEAGVPVNAVDSASRTALHSAVVLDPEPDEKVLCYLIEAGVDIDAEDWNGQTALSMAVGNQSLTTVKLLLQQGANTEASGDEEETPLMQAINNDDVSMVELLLDHGATIEKSRESSMNTPLHQAVINRQVEMVRMLLARGASPAACNDLGRTPVDIARSKGYWIFLDILFGLDN